jgi:hypothetical protein
MSFECQSAGLEYDQSSCHCRSQDYTNPTCPDGCQDLIDKLYEACSDQEQTKLAGQTFVWNTDAAPLVKQEAEKCGCGGAGQVAPALIWVALASLLSHFLS